MDIDEIIGQLRNIESKLYRLADKEDHYYHFRDTEDIRIDVSLLISELSSLEDNESESLWTPIEEKRPRAGQFVLMKNDEHFVAFACGLKGTDDYFIRKGQKFHNPIAWTTKDKLMNS